MASLSTLQMSRGDIKMNINNLVKQAIAKKPSLTPKIPMSPKSDTIPERVEILEEVVLEGLVNEDGG